jgi:tetratricopeptide (TPR) repeat protein
MSNDKENQNIFTNIGNHIINHWSFFVSIISILALLIGCLVYNVSPLHAVREVAIKQHQEDLKNDFITYHNDLGTQFLKLEQYDAAKNEFKQVLEVDPLNQQARTNLLECDVYRESSNKSSDPEIIQMELDEVMQENKSNSLVYLYLGDFVLRNGDQKAALEYYQKQLI